MSTAPYQGNGNGQPPVDTSWQQSFTEAAQQQQQVPQPQPPQQVQTTYPTGQEAQQQQQIVPQQPQQQPAPQQQHWQQQPRTESGQWMAYPEDIQKGPPQAMEPVTPVQPQQPVQQQQQVNPLIQQAQQLGIDLTGAQTEADIWARTAEHIGRMNEQKQNWETQQQHQFASQQQQQQTPQQPDLSGQSEEEDFSVDKHFAKSWNMPEENPAWDQMIQQGAVVHDPATGAYVPTEDYKYLAASPILRDLNQFQHAQQAVKRTQQLWGAYQEPIKRMIQQEFNNLWQDRYVNEQNKQYLDQFAREHADILKNPETNKRLMGQVTHLEGLMPGATDQQILELAMKLEGFDGQQQQQQPPQQMQQAMPPQQQQPPQQQMAPHVNAQTPPANMGTYPQAPPPESFMQQAAQSQDVNYQGYSTVEPPDVQNQTELEQMFTSAWRTQNPAA